MMSLRRLARQCVLLWHVLLVEQAFNVPDHCPSSTTASQSGMNNDDKVFTVGGLFSIHQQDVNQLTGQTECTATNPLLKPRFHRFAVEQAEALILAVDMINSRSDILTNATLHYAMWDTCGFSESHCVENQAQALVENNDVIGTILGPFYYEGPEPYSEHDIVDVYEHIVMHNPGSSTGRAAFPFVDIPFIYEGIHAHDNINDMLVYQQESCVLQAQAAVDILNHVGWQQVLLVTSGDNCGRRSRQEFANYVINQSSTCQPNVTYYEILDQQASSKSISGSGRVNDPIRGQGLDFLDIYTVSQTAPQAVVLLSSMLHANRFIQSFFRLPVSARHSFSFLLGEFWGMVDDPDELFQMILDVKQEVEKVVSIRSQIEGIDAFQNHMASLRWNSKSLQKNAFLRDYWENKFNCSISEKTCNSEDFLEPITRPIVRHVVAPLVIDSIYTITAYLDNFTKANTGQSVYYNNQKSIQEGSNHPVTKITSWTGNIISLIHPSAPPMGWLQPSRWVYEFLLLNTTGNQTEQNQYVLLGKWEINNGNRTLEFDDTTHSWNSETSVTCLIPNTVDPTEMPSFTLSQEIDLEVSSIQPNQAQPPTTTNSSLKCSHTKVIGLVAVPIGIAVFHVLFGIFFVVRKGWPTVRHSALSLGGVLLIIDSIVVILIAILIVSNALPSLECDNLILDFLINTFGCVCYAALLVKLLSQSGSTLNQFTARLSVYVLIVSIQMTLSGLAFFNFNIKDTLYQTNADHCLEARQHIMVVVAYWYNVAINVFSVVTLLIAYCGQHQLMFNSKPQVVVAVATTCFIFQAVAVSILLWTSNCLVHSAFLVVTAVYPAIVTLAISVTTTMSSVLKKRYLDENGIPTSISVRRDLPRIQSHHYISNLMQNSAFLSLQIFLEDDVIKEMHDVVIDPNRLDVGKEIGKGNFGEVLQGKLDGTVPVAIKSIQSRLSQSEVNSFIKEGLQMKNLNHPNVMELIGICWSDDPTNERHVSPYIVLPFMDLGDLKTFLRKRRPNRRTEVPDNPSKEPIDLVQLVKFGHQIARGMEYISAKGIIHRDLAARNCMINWNQEIKVADFGLARTTVEGKEYYRMGQGGELPIRWMALESLVYMTFDVKTDVWSYGVTLWEVMTLAQVPYPGRQNQDVIALLRSGQRLERPENCPEEIYEIMSQCWDVYPESRPSFTSIVELLEEFLSEAMNYFDPTTPKLVEPPTDLPTPQQSEEMEEEKQSKEPDNACACACDVAADSKDAMATVIANESLTDELRPKTDVECKLETTETLNEAVDERAEETTATSNSD